MKQQMKRILSVALVLCLAVNVFCNITETAQAAAYTKTIKKTFKIKAGETKSFKFMVKSKADITVTAKAKGDSEQYRYIVIHYEGSDHDISVITIPDTGISNTKIKAKKGTQELKIYSAAQKNLTFTVEIKTKKPVLKFTSLKKIEVKHCNSPWHNH